MFPGIKNILFLDFETYYAHTYTLRSLTIPQYLLDARYETIMCAAALNGEPSHAVDGPDFGSYISQFDPDTTATVTFNSLFDNSILAWHYGWVPRLMLDSMNMARALRGHILPKLNLDTVTKVLGTPHQKGKTIEKVIDMRRSDIIAKGLWPEFCQYANDDNECSRDIFKMLIGEFPVSERKIMDLVIRCAVQPRFMLDRQHLATHLTNVRNQKVTLINACLPPTETPVPLGCSGNDLKEAIGKSKLMSAMGFQAALESLGVEIEYKASPADPTKFTPAFAKTDGFMERLQEHLDPRVQALACARLGVKSTQEETRTVKFIDIANLPWARYRDGSPRIYSGGEMPVALRYAGAHTHRLSGDWRLNMQNMPRSMPGRLPQLRKALIAPPGYVVVAGDLAQIEARLVAWLAGCEPLLAEFARPGGDPYSAFARIVFGDPNIDRHLVVVDPVTGAKTKPYQVQGFIGKTGILGLGYQCGATKFYNMVLMLARVTGIDISQIGWTMQLAERTVYGYRDKYHPIKTLWYLLQTCTQQVWSQPGTQRMNVGPVLIGYGYIEGPNGMYMLYKNPRRTSDNDYVYEYGWGHYKMYGGKMLENIIQFLARIIIMNAALRMADLGYNFVLQAHDELVYIVPLAEEAKVKAILYRELTRRPSWGRDIPLEAECASGPTYGDAK